jgi:hypothetical protein
LRTGSPVIEFKTFPATTPFSGVPAEACA